MGILDSSIISPPSLYARWFLLHLVQFACLDVLIHIPGAVSLRLATEVINVCIDIILVQAVEKVFLQELPCPIEFCM